jgi:predicted MFS family arabinose efflux permease
MDNNVKNYFIVTLSYWGFTITDGAIRMLVVLYFHLLGYTPLEIAMLFIFYEFFGIVTNLVGGWLGSRVGLNLTMHLGMGLQIIALLMLTVPDEWLGVIYVMFAQALSGIAKDLNKMSAKASVKTFLPEHSESKLFRWIAVLTGSKNALKGAGFFVGAVLMEISSFRGTLLILASFLGFILLFSFIQLPGQLGKSSTKPKFTQVFSKSREINWLSAARFFLFGARDIWFVVGLPVFLYSVLGWGFSQVGSFLALWIIGYGVVQAAVPSLIRQSHHGKGPDGKTAQIWAYVLFLLVALLAMLLQNNFDPAAVLIIGLAGFGIVFAINSAVHSYLIVAWSDRDKVSMNVGFYYMANAGGRLTGTLLSGWVYQTYGMAGCLWWSAGFVLITALLSSQLKRR